MGRAMLIVCAACLIVVGMINVTTSKQGLRMTEVNVRYADFIMAKNTAHTAIQIAMQLINSDEDWPEQHGSSTPWVSEIDGRSISLYARQIEHPDFWEADTLYLISNAEYDGISAEVRSLYLKQPFNTLVPDFLGSITLPSGFNSFNIDGSAHEISGVPPEESGCEKNMPGLVVDSQEMADQLPEENINIVGDPEVQVNSDLNYEPTDELIARLLNSGNGTTINGDYSGTMGTASEPGVFFVEDGVKLTGEQSEGFGILVIRSGGMMEYEGALEVAGNFEWNGLMIFENAFEFDGRGTPTVNGSVLVGNTADYDGDPINISMGGNLQVNYDCRGEDYARMAAALAVEQNLYTHIVTSENANYDSPDF
ncbi:MAG: hypothetical protein ACQER4_08065 [Bacteroidota bacterium]